MKIYLLHKISQKLVVQKISQFYKLLYIYKALVFNNLKQHKLSVAIESSFLATILYNKTTICRRYDTITLLHS